MTVVKPEGHGPFPVVLQFHGCGGLFAMQFDYAEAARSAGVAVVIVDSFAPRGISRVEAQATICTGIRLRGAERSRDVLAMLGWVEAQSWADPSRIAVAGWSHGAWAVMEALARPAPAALPISSAILFYPYCGPLSGTLSRGWGVNRPRVYGVICGRDSVVGWTNPERTLRRLERDGLNVGVTFLPDASHGFDEEAPRAPPNRFRPQLAKASHGWYAEALSESLLAASGGPAIDARRDWMSPRTTQTART